jgi:large subunit ribosomal protein L21
MKLAVIRTGGKQYLVTPGKKVQVDKLALAEGAQVPLETLLVSDEKGDQVSLGKPGLDALTGTIVKHRRGDKISVIKFKRKVRYRRHRGHRQDYTDIVVDAI